jgi:hypothetical protein
MGSIVQQFTGWPLAEAIECCADPDLLSARVAAHRAWRDAGSPSMFSYLSEYLHEHGAYQHNQTQRHLRDIFEQKNQSDTQLKCSLFEHLLAERIIARGRTERPTADLKAIPASAWQYLRISDVRKSVVREGAPAKTKIFDIQIYPMVESPDAIDRLVDRSFVDAFQMCIVNDPQLGAARKRAIASGGTPASFGNEWHPYRAVWPVVLGEGPDIEPATESAEKSDEPTSDILVEVANRIQGHRFAKLIGYLSTGRLGAEGVPAAGGTSTAIPRAIWQQDGIYIDLENADLLEASLRAKHRLSCPLRPLFTGLVLRKPESVRRLSEIGSVDHPPVASRKVSKSKKNITSKTTTERACCDWLVDLMRRSPDVRPEIHDLYWREAHVQWPKSLSKRGFDRAWAKAVDEARAPEWSAGGRPRKSPRAKPPQQ